MDIWKQPRLLRCLGLKVSYPPEGCWSEGTFDYEHSLRQPDLSEPNRLKYDRFGDTYFSDPVQPHDHDSAYGCMDCDGLDILPALCYEPPEHDERYSPSDLDHCWADFDHDSTDDGAQHRLSSFGLKQPEDAVTGTYCPCITAEPEAYSDNAPVSPFQNVIYKEPVSTENEDRLENGLTDFLLESVASDRDPAIIGYVLEGLEAGEDELFLAEVLAGKFNPYGGLPTASDEESTDESEMEVDWVDMPVEQSDGTGPILRNLILSGDCTIESVLAEVSRPNTSVQGTGSTASPTPTSAPTMDDNFDTYSAAHKAESTDLGISIRDKAIVVIRYIFPLISAFWLGASSNRLP